MTRRRNNTMQERGNIPSTQSIGIGICMVIYIFLNLQQSGNMFEVLSPTQSTNNDNTVVVSKTTEEVELGFDWINKKLIGPPISGSDRSVMNSVDYEKWYTVEDVERSITYMEEHADILIPFATRQLATRHREAQLQCQSMEGKSSGVLDRGGWCLHAGLGNKKLLNTNYIIPQDHVQGSQRIITELSNLITAENVTSINDFGAGVGQYKPEIVQRHPELDYHAYDGAGNVYEYTDGNVDFVDLTFPIGLPKRDWVLSLEVGEHVSSMFEGVFIRNLHRHNTHGIILSWGILGQPGHSHVNNHSNDYIIAVFESLGYTYQKHWTDKFRNPNDNYKWFTQSVMVFKRKIPLVA
mmetsp:Transcript_37931/g.43312  ORF Transcript_37931/g.43312 Transcript_37931/m.43312 type:complete len:352 (-) Transcript_37931:136-1191(-)